MSVWVRLLMLLVQTPTSLLHPDLDLISTQRAVYEEMANASSIRTLSDISPELWESLSTPLAQALATQIITSLGGHPASSTLLYRTSLLTPKHSTIH